jgi:hypothetical protein
MSSRHGKLEILCFFVTHVESDARTWLQYLRFSEHIAHQQDYAFHILINKLKKAIIYSFILIKINLKTNFSEINMQI